MVISAGAVNAGSSGKISPASSNKSTGIKTNSKSIKSTSDSKNSKASEESFLDSAENNSPMSSVSGSHEAQVNKEISRFQLALKTGYLGKDFVSEAMLNGGSPGMAGQGGSSQGGGAPPADGGGKIDLGISMDWSDFATTEPENNNEEINNFNFDV